MACVEPAPALVEHIQKHLNLNRVTECVKLYPVALGAVDGEGELLLASEMLGNRLASAEKPADRLPKVKVPIWSFSRLLETLGWDAVDVAKIDCEGCEYGLFSATPEDVLKRVKVWFVEVHGPVGAIAERLRSLGYEVEYDLYWRDMYNLRAWQPGARLPWEAPSVHKPEIVTS